MPIYMKYDGITGTGTGKYNGWIVLESCQLENLSKDKEVVVSKFMDNASSRLVEKSLRGEEEKKVTIDFVGAGENFPYMSIELEDVLISSYTVSGSGGDKPHETFSLNFTKITYTSKPTAPAKDPKHVQEKATWNFAVQNSRYS